MQCHRLSGQHIKHRPLRRRQRSKDSGTDQMLLRRAAMGSISDNLLKTLKLAFENIGGGKASGTGFQNDIRILKCSQNHDFCVCLQPDFFSDSDTVQTAG